MSTRRDRERPALSLLLTLVSCLLFGACASGPPVVGTWVLLENDIRPEAPAPLPSAAELEQRPIKLLTKDHFAFGSQSPETGALAGGGTYVYAEGNYVETVEYHWIEGLVGRTIHFDCQLDGDRWYHEGVVTAADGRRYHIRETWLRWKEDEEE